MEAIKYLLLAIVGLIGVSIIPRIIARGIYEEKFNFMIKISQNNEHFDTSNNKKREDSE